MSDVMPGDGLVMPDKARFATMTPDTITKGPLIAGEPVTVEAPGNTCPLRIGHRLRLFLDDDFRLLTPNGFDLIRGAVDDDDQLSWAEVLLALRRNWVASPWLRKHKPTLLGQSRVLGLSGAVVLVRDVTKDECRWLDRDMKRGEKFRVYKGPTYGAISKAGVAVQEAAAGEMGDEGPFIELPADALRKDLLADEWHV